MSNLIKSKDRVSNHGEVFTPKHIVDEMLDQIPNSIWSDKEYICLEPTCGNGNFIVEIIRKKLENGLSIFQAINTTFGMDIMEDNIFECRQRVLEICKEYETNDTALFRLACVIVNNIFRVDDSLSYITNKEWENKKFYDEDPTNVCVGKGLNKFFKKTQTNQILPPEKQKSIQKQTTIFLKKDCK